MFSRTKTTLFDRAKPRRWLRTVNRNACITNRGVVNRGFGRAIQVPIGEGGGRRRISGEARFRRRRVFWPLRSRVPRTARISSRGPVRREENVRKKIKHKKSGHDLARPSVRSPFDCRNAVVAAAAARTFLGTASGEVEGQPRRVGRRAAAASVHSCRAASVAVVSVPSFFFFRFASRVPFADCCSVWPDGGSPVLMLSRDSFRVDPDGGGANSRDGPSAADGPSECDCAAVTLLSVRVYDRPHMDVPNYPGRPCSSASRSAGGAAAAGPRRTAAHAHRRACARRGAMRRAYSTPPPKVRTFLLMVHGARVASQKRRTCRPLFIFIFGFAVTGYSRYAQHGGVFCVPLTCRDKNESRPNLTSLFALETAVPSSPRRTNATRLLWIEPRSLAA